CNKTFVWKRPYNKKYKEQHWFELWITEGYSTRQLVSISKHSRAKINRIRNYWLSKEPPKLLIDLSKIKYVMLDGTYFHKDGCLIVLMDYITRKIITYEYIGKENYHDVYTLLKRLKEQDLNPLAVILDGHQKVIQAFIDLWPSIIIQRCLFHIKKQGQQWLRTFPKTKAGKELKDILKILMFVKTEEHKKEFIRIYANWFFAHKRFIKQLPITSVANKDLKRTTSLMNNALPNMFHYVKDQNIASTTNLLENLFSQLKQKYRDHRGLSKQHKIAYLKWFCYFKYMSK
ncbi:transposase, partial [bacterium]